MITYKQLGKHGRLGNQLFQYAALYSIGFMRGLEIGIPDNQKISEVFDIKPHKLIDTTVPTLENIFASVVQERDFKFDPNFFLVPDGSDIRGYFQSGNYFRHCQDSLRKELTFHKNISESAESFLSSRRQSPLCSLHVRRGDYVNLTTYHTNLGSEYYQTACNVVRSNVPSAKFLVFSDDPEWCKSAFSDSAAFEVVDIRDDAVELCVMSKCPIHIIANSSFSWWSAWLSGSRAVVAPQKWFAERGPKDWSTVYEPGWVVL